MNSYKTKNNIYYLFAVIVYIASIYNLFIYIYNNELFFTNTTLLIPAMQKIPLPYSSWTLDSKLLLFPDIFFVNIIQMFTSNTIALIITYVLLLATSIYYVFTYVAGIRYHFISTVCLYTLFWTMILVFILSENSLFSFFFAPNGYIGFTLIYFIIVRLCFNLLAHKPSFRPIFLILILITLMAISAPIITAIYLGIPLIILIKYARRLGYNIPKSYISIEILILLSLVAGYILQYYLFSFTDVSSSLPFWDIIDTLYADNPTLFILGLLGGAYCIVHGFAQSLNYSYVFVNRIFAIGMILATLAVVMNLINPLFYVLFFMFVGICYGVPLFVLGVMSLISVQIFTLVHTLVFSGTLCILFLFYWNNVVKSEAIYSVSLMNTLDTALEGRQGPLYVMAPKEISNIISIFNKNNLTVIPYNPETLEYPLFQPTFMDNKKYSALIIDEKQYESPLIKELLILIGKPTTETKYKEYRILAYPEGFIMPDSGIIATYTTPLGNSIRNSIKDAIDIPLAKNFTIDGTAINSIKILEIDKSVFVVLVFPKDAVIPKDIEYNIYTLSTTSSGFRKLFSGIRRELLTLGSILPLEDKSTFILKKKDLYILPSGEHVGVVDITDKVKKTLMFLSIGIGNKKPIIILEYPDLPILLNN